MLNDKINLSKCCNAKTSFIPPSFGESGKMICNCCLTGCGVNSVPKYQQFRKGIYRLIQYTDKLGNKI